MNIRAILFQDIIGPNMKPFEDFESLYALNAFLVGSWKNVATLSYDALDELASEAEKATPTYRYDFIKFEIIENGRGRWLTLDDVA